MTDHGDHCVAHSSHAFLGCCAACVRCPVASGGAVYSPHRTFGRRRMIRPPAIAATALLAAGLLVPVASPPAAAATATTAWQGGAFHVDTPNVIRRSDI